MNSLKCTNCRLVYIDRGHPCPRCGTGNAADPPPAERRGGSRRARAVLACALLLVAGGVACYHYYHHYRLKPEPTPAYVETIRASEQFRQLATVRVNQAPLAPPDGSHKVAYGSLSDKVGAERWVTFAAYVLEKRGLLAFENVIREERSQPMVGYRYNQRMGRGGVMYDHYDRVEKPGPPIVTRHLTVSLTPAGEKEAESWKETEEACGGEPDVRFWRVPVGESEFVRLGQVIDWPGVDGKRKLTAKFVWRWRPNRLGQFFDRSGQTIGLLPDEAQKVATRLGLDSLGEMEATAELEATEGGGWRVLSVKPMANGRDVIKVD